MCSVAVPATGCGCCRRQLLLKNTYKKSIVRKYFIDKNKAEDAVVKLKTQILP